MVKFSLFVCLSFSSFLRIQSSILAESEGAKFNLSVFKINRKCVFSLRMLMFAECFFKWNWRSLIIFCHSRWYMFLQVKIIVLLPPFLVPGRAHLAWTSNCSNTYHVMWGLLNGHGTKIYLIFLFFHWWEPIIFLSWTGYRYYFYYIYFLIHIYFL